MPRRKLDEIPLPDGWDYAYDYDGKIFFIDHLNEKTTWIDPRDMYTKPQTFADCTGNELPFGWEESFDPIVGNYYINHINNSTQLEDPRLEWRNIQEDMLRDYLQSAQEALDAKQEILEIKRHRLNLAEDEYNQLNSTLNNLNSSRTLSSSSSSISTKYDPNILKSDVSSAKNRVSRLKIELEQIQDEMIFTKRGVETLTLVKDKLNSHDTGYYNISEAQAILNELRSIQQSLCEGEKEKANMMQSLVQLKDDLIRNFPESIALNSFFSDKISIASQTELTSTHLMPIEARLAEMVKFRSEYDESRKKVHIIRNRLADLAEKAEPLEFESDKDRLLLIQEKEQLLRELRSVIVRAKTKPQKDELQTECKRLERDLNAALELSNKAIADRVKLHEEKQTLLLQLKNSLKAMAVLEAQLKNLSASTLSISSSSSLGSLSTHSSKASLSSGISFTDIYGVQETTGSSTTAVKSQSTVNMNKLQKRIENLLLDDEDTNSLLQPVLKANNAHSTESPIYENLPVLQPPSYEKAVQQQKEKQQQQLQLQKQTQSSTMPQKIGKDLKVNISQECLKRLQNSSSLSPLTDLLEKSRNNRFSYENIEPSLSPISETPSSPNFLLLNSSSSNGSNTRSVSAAVSDESVAGDSGVFEASHKNIANNCRFEQHVLDLETTQLLIQLKFDFLKQILFVAIDKWRNILALVSSNNQQEITHIYIKVTLLPSLHQHSQTYWSKAISDVTKTNINESFEIPVPFPKLFTKTLQISMCWSQDESNSVLGSVQISLADFNFESVNSKWYNMLSESTNHSFGLIREESSDDSTIVASQTSTLTRAHGSENSRCFAATKENNEHVISEEVVKSEADGESTVENDAVVETVFANEDTAVAATATTPLAEKIDKETNTTNLLSRLPLKIVNEDVVQSNLNATAVIVKRSQTFSPTNKNYICKLNRSDSDSAMSSYNYGNGNSNNGNIRLNLVPPFQRNCLERRSLRIRKQMLSSAAATSLSSCALTTCTTASITTIATTTATTAMETTTMTTNAPKKSSNSRLTCARTSVDLELDLHAQKTRLQTLNAQLNGLKDVLDQLEKAKKTNDFSLIQKCLEDERVQIVLNQAQILSSAAGSFEDRKVEKLLKKTSNEIYRLRKSKVGNSKPDIATFKEKIAFFTRPSSRLESATSGEITSSSKQESETRYEYIVDRIYGVQV